MQNLLLCISLALILGLLMSRLAKRVGLPAVTAYLITGLLLGPFVVGRLGLPGVGFHTMEEVSGFGIISNTALGFIAFTIGNEFRLEDLRHMGRQAVTVGILQAIITTALVDVALVTLHFLRPDALSVPSAMVRSVVLFSVLVNELVGPTLTRNALFAAGEIHPDELKPDPVPVKS